MRAFFRSYEKKIGEKYNREEISYQLDCEFLETTFFIIIIITETFGVDYEIVG